MCLNVGFNFLYIIALFIYKIRDLYKTTAEKYNKTNSELIDATNYIIGQMFILTYHNW